MTINGYVISCVLANVGHDVPPINRHMSADSVASLNSLSSACSRTSQQSTAAADLDKKKKKKNWVSRDQQNSLRQYYFYCLPFSLYPSIRPSTHPYIHPSIHSPTPSIHLSICPSIRPSFLPSIHPSTHLSTHASMHEYLVYIHAYIHAYRHSCIHTYIHICMHAYIHTCINMCKHTYLHTCIYASNHPYMIHPSSLRSRHSQPLISFRGYNGINFSIVLSTCAVYCLQLKTSFTKAFSRKKGKPGSGSDFDADNVSLKSDTSIPNSSMLQGGGCGGGGAGGQGGHPMSTPSTPTRAVQLSAL